jgi:hypothetical protein
MRRWLPRTHSGTVFRCQQYTVVENSTMEFFTIGFKLIGRDQSPG